MKEEGIKHEEESKDGARTRENWMAKVRSANTRTKGVRKTMLGIHAWQNDALGRGYEGQVETETAGESTECERDEETGTRKSGATWQHSES